MSKQRLHLSFTNTRSLFWVSFWGAAIWPEVWILSGSATTKILEFWTGGVVNEKEKTGWLGTEKEPPKGLSNFHKSES
jgi:Zn-dependent M28 family amino/carboxypeptidase